MPLTEDAGYQRPCYATRGKNPCFPGEKEKERYKSSIPIKSRGEEETHQKKHLLVISGRETVQSPQPAETKKKKEKITYYQLTEKTAKCAKKRGENRWCNLL